MKRNLLSICAIAALSLTFAACGNDEPSGNGQTPDVPEIEYPNSAIVWGKDSTVILDDHFVVPENVSLYVEEGVTVIASNTEVKPEIVVLGNMYCMGTEENPITFTVEESSKNDRFSRNWGGIICGYNCEELYLNYVTIEYGGAQTTENSASFINQLFKSETGEGVPAIHFCNRDGRMIITNCTLFNNAEDQIYITGGHSIVANNRFISSGFDGGDAINYKSDCLADVAYNLIYDSNTNGFKLSNDGFVEYESHIVCYNNTLVNDGWRRPGIKGGSMWLEANIYAELYNNIIYDCRWGLKHATDEPEIARPVYTPNFYFASTQEGIDQMAADEIEGVLVGANDKRGNAPGENDPLFANYTRQSNMNINVGSNGEGAPQTWNDTWDFHLSAGSPALTGGIVNFERNFSEGIVMEGLAGIVANNTFVSPEPSSYFGAYGAAE